MASDAYFSLAQMLPLHPYEEANGHTTVQFRWLEDEQLSEGDTKLEPTRTRSH